MKKIKIGIFGAGRGADIAENLMLLYVNGMKREQRNFSAD